MTDPFDVETKARALIRSHGHDAWWPAAQSADAASERGDHVVHLLWMRVLRRIEAVERLGADATVQ